MADPITPPPGFVPIGDNTPPEGSTSGVAPPPPPPPGFVPLAAPGMLESFGRGLTEGASFGFDDKLGMDKERRAASHRANPWTHFMGELVGSAVPMIGAALLPTGGTQVAAGSRAAQLASKGYNLARGALVPGEINTAAQAVGQGAKLGAVYGGLSGAGHADVAPTDSWSDALAERAKGAASGTATGTLFGGALGAAGHGLYRAGQAIGGMRALAAEETAGQGHGSLKVATRKLEEDRITPQQLIDQITSEFPSHTDVAQGGLAKRFWGDATGKHQPITSEHVEETVRRAMMGETADDISAALRAANGGVGPGEQAVQTLLDELAARHLGPLNLLDRAALARPGAGQNTQMTMRAAAATPGEHVSIAREALNERQSGALTRMHDVFNRLIGTTDADAAIAAHSDKMAQAATRGYGAAKAEERPFDLMPIIQKYQADYGGKRGPIPEAVQKAIDAITVKEPTTKGVSALGRTEAAELPLAERENLMQMWRYAHQPIAEPQSLSQWVVSYGGLKDKGGDVANIFGGMAPRGMIRKSGGQNLDDTALRAWEDGFFPDLNRRPTINEFLELLERDVRGDKVVRPEHYDAMQAISDKYQMLRDLSDVGVTARTLPEAMQQMGFGGQGKPGFTPRPPQTLQEFIDARQNIKALKEAAPPGGAVARKLNEIYNELSQAVADTNPKWKIANDVYREGAAATESLKAGEHLAMALNSGTRERLALFDQATKDVKRAKTALDAANKAVRAAEKRQKTPTPEQIAAVDHAEAMMDASTARIDLFKVGLVRKLSDTMHNKGSETHSMVAELGRPAAKKILTEVLGPDDAKQFFKVVDAEKAMLKTYQSQFGSQTTPLAEGIKELNWAPRFEASMLNPLTWGHPLMRLAQEYAARSINAKRNTDLMNLYTNTRPVDQLQALRQMQTLHAARSKMGERIGRPVVGSSGAIPNAIDHLVTADQAPARPAQQTLRPYKP